MPVEFPFPVDRTEVGPPGTFERIPLDRPVDPAEVGPLAGVSREWFGVLIRLGRVAARQHRWWIATITLLTAFLAVRFAADNAPPAAYAFLTFLVAIWVFAGLARARRNGLARKD